MLLMILPFVMPQPGMSYCLAVSPTVILSVMFVVLYLVDQVHDLAEQLYICIQIVLNIIALVLNLMSNTASGAVFSLFLAHLLIAICIDLYYVIQERGFALLH
ncbi:unnamed protein product [Diatraea saccharalis]|uniref:Uncharacterized protein n=1 Tax=Diatraea saccharalis TaxID=40085 RepID=A0A9N9WD67_9NEOP|nr:unnamed protein product [Diatraea saccharalis]